LLASIAAAGALCCGAGSALAYVQTNLVSDIPGLAAITDPELINPWGVSESTTSPFWVSNQNTNTSTLYTVTNNTDVTKVNINSPSGFVAIPTTASGPQGPTGQVNNTNTSSFLINGVSGANAHFIFANLNGTISAWNGGTTAVIQATVPGAVYTGLAINHAQTQLYAANDAGTGSIDVFNSSFVKQSLPSGAFTDPSLPAGYVPFNVQDINGKVYVTYAPGGRPNQTGATAGMGIVDVYDESGGSLQRLITGNSLTAPLAAPWGLALAPAGFGVFGGDLLVGNFSYVDSKINAFNATTGAYEGTIPIDTGSATAGGLWDLTFGNGGSGGSPDVLYFADGINGEADGLFAAITVAEPSGVALLGVSLALLGVIARKRRAT
jgi:uncharacterized protein (TIGR03118 family)